MTSGRTTKRRSYIKAIGAGVTGIALAGCSGGNQDDQGGQGTTTGMTDTGPSEVMIGGNHPLSGALSRAGTAMANAGKLAVQHINEGGVVPGFEDGGIPSLDGATLKFVSKDNKGKQQLGGEIERELADQGAKAIIGCYSSPVSRAATQAAEREQVPHVVDVSVADGVVGKDSKYAWRVAPNANRFSQNYAEFMPAAARANGQSMKTAAIVYLNNSFGQAIRKHLQNYLPDNDVEVVLKEGYSFGQSSMDTEATKIKQQDADAFIFVGYAGGGIRMMNSFQNVNYTPPIMSGCATPTFTSLNAIKQIGKFANGGFGNNYDFNFNLDWTDTVFADYRETFGERLTVIHAVMSYTTVVTIANAIDQAGSASRQDINAALKNIEVSDHPAAMGPVTFGSNHENKNALTPMLQVQNLQADIVWPTKYAQSKPKFG